MADLYIEAGMDIIGIVDPLVSQDLTASLQTVPG